MKYIIEFSKTGIICYTSHLDIMKVFKRAFKRAGIDIAYSQGFNPHPKMGFAQPLSLGYWGLQEYVEFETAEREAGIADDEAMNTASGRAPEEMLSALTAIMPEGLELKRIIEAPWLKKTLAAENIAAEYMIGIPVGSDSEMAEMADKDIRYEDTDVCCLITDGEESGLRGARAFANEFVEEMLSINTVVIAPDTIHSIEELRMKENLNC